MILDLIGYENLIHTSVYEFIKTYFCDFNINNQNHIQQLNLQTVLKEFESVAIFFAKLVIHFDMFYIYK